MQKAESMGREEKRSPVKKAPAVFHGSNASGWWPWDAEKRDLRCFQEVELIQHAYGLDIRGTKREITHSHRFGLG